MNSTYFKATIREITYSWGKFISIVLIILLGSLLYVGIRATGPDLDNSADRYFAQQNLGDLNVTSTLGLTNKDLKLVKSDDNVQTAEASHMVTIKKSQNQVVQVYSYSKAAKLNKLKVVSGHLPTKNNQIVLDAKAKSDGYRLGQTYTLPKTDGLKSKSFKIVGFVNSPLFVSSTDRGTTNVGSGEVDYFAYTPEQSFDQKAFATIAVRFDNTADLTAGTSAYNQRVNRDQEQLESKLKARPTQRRTELTGTALSKINRQLARLQKQAKQLQAVPAQYQSATTKAAAKKLTAGISKLQAAQKKLQQTPQATYMYNDRTANVGYQDYFDESKSIAAIAVIFPGFFLFIAVLITFTTISRMIEKNRREIGLMRALGYTKGFISMKYVIYSVLAGILGSIAGGVLGTMTLPKFIFSMLSNNNLTQYHGVIPWAFIIEAVIAGLVATLGSAAVVLIINLREKPTELMRERAPKAGKRILMERIKPLWNRMNFNQKVSYRNLFRYKTRMIMTIVGIAGCTGLMLAGFGIRDSVNDLIPDQFNQVQHYQGIVTLSDANKQIHDKNIKSQKSAMVQSITVSPTKGTKRNATVTMVAPKSSADFEQYVSLKNSQTNQNEKLSNSGVIITEKLATDMNAKKGTILSTKLGNKLFKVRVAAVTKNYAGHYMYLTPKYFNKVSLTKYSANSRLLKLKSVAKGDRQQTSRSLLKQSGVLNVTYPRYAGSALGTVGLSSVVLIFIALSAALGLVVLYNLTNVNISERMRELSTIKVLGFYDNEVTAYVARENVVLTLAGIVFGWFIGLILHHFIMIKAQTGAILFPLTVHYPGYIWSAVLTACFSLAVGVITHYKLKNIDMLDSLSSQE
ncbi:outer membrane-specific lipoprotein transporter subunit LolE [Lentilactobacillus sunkii]|uniref:Outer membrane-specific lipoprotein transporter subunit LolE n=1 Tax=Lentilactobacillus sunkii TaxID=481719 RepID=A0A1E7XAX7_9LACO|nr:FtsX-like permease family protein [Lentilactobacillus sunkii]OFA10260.1 outer membrane-specific lipoprotein transporter subunit LolE [Lentilactobacillus sunkii]